MNTRLFKLILAFCIFIFAFCIFSNAQSYSHPFNIVWEKTYGGSKIEFNDYKGHTIANSQDGGYFFISNSKSNDGDVTGNHGQFDVWLVKIDGTGKIVWQKSIGGNQDEDGMFVISTLDGGCLVGGETHSNNSGDIIGSHGSGDGFVVKLNSSGNIQWEKTLGSNKEDWLVDGLQNPDGTYVLAAFTDGNNGDVSGNRGGRDAWVIKLDQNGSIMWQHCYGGSGDDGVRHQSKIMRCMEGGFMLTTMAASLDGDVSGFHGIPGVDLADAWLVKLDDNGNIQWQKCFGGSGFDFLENIIQLADGNYMASGGTVSSNGDILYNNGMFDWWLVKISQTGNLIWSRVYGGSGAEALHGKVFQLPNGDLVLPSGSRSNDHDCIGLSGAPDLWFVKTDSVGNILSYNIWGGQGYENTSYSVINSDGSIIVCGMTDPTEINPPDVAFKHDDNAQVWILKIVPNPADTFAITTTSLSLNSHCTGSSPFSVSVGYTKRGTFKGNNIFTAELSDANGSFASPIIVGSIHSLSSGIISCTIPGNLPTGDHYAIRVKSSNPVFTGITSGHLLSIQSCSLVKSDRFISKDGEKTVNSYSLYVFPNPVSTSTTISFSLSQSQKVSFKIFDMNGRLIKTVAERFFAAGEQQIKWNTADAKAGVYLLIMEAANYSDSKKLAIVK